MSNTQTPMKKLKHFTDTITSLLDPNFKTLRLNKSKPKYNPHRYGTHMSGYSLGVDSDHIVVFKDQNSDASFGIVFNYIGKSIEEWTYQLTYKECDIPCKHKEQDFLNDHERVDLNKSILFSAELALNDFKDLLKSLIDQLGNNEGDVADLVFSFIKKEISAPSCIVDFDKQLSSSIKEISIALKPQIDDLRVSKRLHDAAEIVIEGKTIAVECDLLKLDSYHLVANLQKDLLAAKSAFEDDANNVRKKHNIEKLHADALSLESDHLKAQRNLNIAAQLEIKNKPVYLKKSLTDQIKLSIKDLDI